MGADLRNYRWKAGGVRSVSEVCIAGCKVKIDLSGEVRWRDRIEDGANGALRFIGPCCGTCLGRASVILTGEIFVPGLSDSRSIDPA